MLKTTITMALMIYSSSAFAEDLICTPSAIASGGFTTFGKHELKIDNQTDGEFNRIVFGDKPRLGYSYIENGEQSEWLWSDLIQVDTEHGYMFYSTTEKNTMTTIAINHDLTKYILQYTYMFDSNDDIHDLDGLYEVGYCLEM